MLPSRLRLSLISLKKDLYLAAQHGRLVGAMLGGVLLKHPPPAKELTVPRYFIHLRNKDLWLEDCEGMDLPDLQAALKATQNANQDLLISLGGVYGLEFEITDHDGRILLKVPVQENRKDQPLSQRQDAQKEHLSFDIEAVLH